MLGVLSRSVRAERIALAAILALIAVVYVWACHYRLDPLDEGYFIYTSSRVFAGELPYRDFSTPYTPAFFYLNAALFRIFGLDLLTLRISLVVARIAIYLLVYLIGRRLMPPAFAALPIVLLLAEDQMPGVWESHPAWWATLAFIGAVWSACRYREQGRLRWWLAASLLAGVSFAFKQNLGLFALAALGLLTLTEPRSLPPSAAPCWLSRLAGAVPPRLAGWLLAAAGPVALAGLGLIFVWVMRAHLDPVVFVMFALPFAALAAERLSAAVREGLCCDRECVRARLSATLWRQGLLVGCFVLVTVPWLVALVAALGPRETPFAAFLGAIDTAGYYYPLEDLRGGLKPLLGVLALVWLVVWVLLRRWSWQLKLGIVLGALALAANLLKVFLAGAAEVHPRPIRAAVFLTVDALQWLVLYLPIPAFFGAFILLWRRRRDEDKEFTLRWLLLAGSLLLLNQWPRIDEVHLLFSGPLLWSAGAYGLWRLFAWATRDLRFSLPGRLGRGAAFAALAALPLASTWPSLEGRREDAFIRQQGSFFQIGTPTYYPMDVPSLAGVKEMDIFSWKYERLAAYFREHSRVGERIFVFPAAPLMYYVVDRPNATRFNHIFPGLLTPSDELETIERLSSVPASWVIWDTFGEYYWLKRGDYQRLIDYVWDVYEPVESIGGYEVLRRRTDLAETNLGREPGPGETR